MMMSMMPSQKMGMAWPATARSVHSVSTTEGRLGPAGGDARTPPPAGPADPELLLPRSGEEHAVDLVGRCRVLDPVRHTPHAAQTPLEEGGGVVEHQLLRLDVDLGAPLLVERRAPGDDQVVELLVAVVGVELAALEHVVQDGVGVEDGVVAP